MPRPRSGRIPRHHGPGWGNLRMWRESVWQAVRSGALDEHRWDATRREYVVAREKLYRLAALDAVAALESDGRALWVTHRTLAEIAHVSEGTAAAYRRCLAAAGFLVIVVKGQRWGPDGPRGRRRSLATVYGLTLPGLTCTDELAHSPHGPPSPPEIRPPEPPPRGLTAPAACLWRALQGRPLLPL